VKILTLAFDSLTPVSL